MFELVLDPVKRVVAVDAGTVVPGNVVKAATVDAVVPGNVEEAVTVDAVVPGNVELAASVDAGIVVPGNVEEASDDGLVVSGNELENVTGSHVTAPKALLPLQVLPPLQVDHHPSLGLPVAPPGQLMDAILGVVPAEPQRTVQVEPLLTVELPLQE